MTNSEHFYIQMIPKKSEILVDLVRMGVANNVRYSAAVDSGFSCGYCS